MNHTDIITQFKLKLESAVITGSKDIRMTRDEYVKVSLALTNLLLQDAELRELNRELVRNTSQPPSDNSGEAILDGGGF